MIKEPLKNLFSFCKISPAQLPQTGNEKAGSLVALGLASFVSALGLGKLKKHD